MKENKPHLFLTGASGLLGRSIHKKFKEASWKIYPIAFTRANDSSEFIKLDITDEDAVNKTIKNLHPDFIIHCAAQRFPDLVEKNPIEARKLNVVATDNIVKAADDINVPVLYISTDYVFDGKTPPYKVTDVTNPVNLYGKLKLDGEEIVLRNKRNLVLRIPVLYGPVLNLSESAVTCLLTPLLSNQKSLMSHTEWRCPSHVDDIAHICFNLASAVLEGKQLNGIFHWCGDEKMTKYEMVMKMADVFHLPSSHIIADTQPGSTTIRPKDTELEKSVILNLGFGIHTPFEKGIKQVLSHWVEQ